MPLVVRLFDKLRANEIISVSPGEEIVLVQKNKSGHNKTGRYLISAQLMARCY